MLEDIRLLQTDSRTIGIPIDTGETLKDRNF